MNKIVKTIEVCLLATIALYRNYISGLMLPRCRFSPTCSAYAEEALRQKGLWPGLLKTLLRLLRCHPFSRANFFDPVR